MYIYTKFHRFSYKKKDIHVIHYIPILVLYNIIILYIYYMYTKPSEQLYRINYSLWYDICPLEHCLMIQSEGNRTYRECT